MVEVKKKWIGLTEDYRKAKLELTHVLRSLKDEKWKDKAKVYVDIVVFKPNHKSDAINMIDGVCDAIKEVIPVDDRYYGVWCDWEIDKENPRLEIRVWQFEG